MVTDVFYSPSYEESERRRSGGARCIGTFIIILSNEVKKEVALYLNCFYETIELKG